jgi:hypothetical protein
MNSTSSHDMRQEFRAVRCSTQQANKHNPVLILEADEPLRAGLNGLVMKLSSRLLKEADISTAQLWRLLHLPAQSLPRQPLLLGKGSLVDPRLRASNEHILIVRVPRAGGRLGCPSHPSETARCASTRDSPSYPSPAGGLFQQPAS